MTRLNFIMTRLDEIQAFLINIPDNYNDPDEVPNNNNNNPVPDNNHLGPAVPVGPQPGAGPARANGRGRGGRAGANRGGRNNQAGAGQRNNNNQLLQKTVTETVVETYDVKTLSNHRGDRVDGLVPTKTITKVTNQRFRDDAVP